jgi:carbonic anhydrase
VCLASQASEEVRQWTYEGELGPEHWGDLSPDFIQCKVGLNQSPIDIVGTVEADLPPLIFDYKSNSTTVINNGHTAQINVEPGNTLTVEGEVFELLQFHIHVPSEHRVNGKSSLLEVHFVHSNERGELAVVATLHNEGLDPPRLAQHIGLIPSDIGKPAPFKIRMSEVPMLSGDLNYYRYNGSLTTPPCSEGVRWYVLRTQATITRQRRDIFNALIGDDARGPQPINARPVLR